MSTTPVVWGLIVSRQGSRRLPGKAMLPLAGKPLIAYTLEAALACPHLSRRWVFTDDPAVLSLAQTYPLDLPFFDRPAWLSGDQADAMDTVRYFLSQFNPADLPDWLVLLQPTSPLRTAEDITGAIDWVTLHPACDYLVSVHRPLKPAHWTYQLDEYHHLQPVLPPQGTYVFPNGAMYVLRPLLLLTGDQSLPLIQRPGVVTQGYEMPWERSLDIDWPVDIALAQWLLAQQAPAMPPAVAADPSPPSSGKRPTTGQPAKQEQGTIAGSGSPTLRQPSLEETPR